MNILTKLVLTTCLAASLQGCIFVVGAAAGAAAISVVYDHRSIANTIKDTKISNAITNKIRLNAVFKQSHIEVTVFHGVVLLTGETPDEAYRKEIATIASTTPNVTRVYNQLTLREPTSTFTRTSDAWITTKIKSEMLTTSDLKSSSIKMVTEDGVVYLMGLVKRQQADMAVEIARQVSGVQKVVKIFQYQS